MARLAVLTTTTTTTFFLLQCFLVAAQPPADYPGTETPYQVIPTGTDAPAATGTVTPENILGTFLYSYNDRTTNFGSGAKGKIDDAYYDAWLISNTAGVASNIDWNNAAALEFLGAPGLNKDQQPQTQAVLANTATVIYSYKNPFQHYIKVRCDDPKEKCQNRPCEPAPNPGDPEPPKPPLAYSLNSDPDSPGVPMINFCAGFFDRRNLADAITYGKALNSPNNLKLASYDSRAQTFLHELFHLDLAADSPKPNPRVDDLTIDIKLGNSGSTYTTVAYGTFATKVLARWQGGGAGVGSTGYYVQRNSDNLAYYALAKYVMTKNGNVYPHLPIVTREIDGPPYPGTLAEFVTEGSNFFLNTTDLTTFESDWASTLEGDDPTCSDDENEAGSALTIDGFAPDSAYPDDYNSQVATWIKALGVTDGSGADAGQQIAIASYINPSGDPAAWLRLLSYDSNKVSVLVANILNVPDYVVDNA